MTEPQEQKPGFFAELKRRRVVRAALAYAAAAFVVLQAGQIVFDALEVPRTVFRVLVIAALAGFPVAILLGWLFDLTSEGLVLSPSGTRRARIVARVKPAVLFGGGGLALLASIAAAVAVGLPRPAAAVVAPGADLIAVVPFTTSGGEEVKVLEQGMVDLLSRNLSEVGSMRTVDPRLVLSRWAERSRGGAPSQQEALELARDTYAGSVLTGSVVQAGASVRISADLLSIDGRRLAAVRVDGAASDLLSLVDTVSLRLLREVWRSTAPIPRLDVGAVTSSDLGAIRAFLEGERFYRASAWAPAIQSFRRAVEADSLFALAHYRLAVAAGWWGGDDGLAARHSALALRHADRLPQREATLVRAEALRLSGRREEAVDTLTAQVERFADDAEAWFLLADGIYHLRDEGAGPGDHPAEQVLSMFDRVLELDPAYVPALIHPLEVAFRAGDTALARRYVDRLAQAPAVDTSAVRVYRLALGALGRGDDARGTTAALASALAAQRSGGPGLGSQASQAALRPLLRHAALLPAERRTSVMDGLPAEVAKRSPAATAGTAIGHLLLAGGRLAEARRSFAPGVARTPPSARGTAVLLETVAVYAGVADTAFLAASATPAERAVAAALAAIDRNDAAGLRRAVARLETVAMDTGGTHARREALVGAARGFVRVIEGEVGAGLNAVEDALDGAFFPGEATEALWFRLVERQAEHAATRSRALRVLEEPWPGDPVFEVLRMHALARALEAEGDAPAARAAYARFVDAAGQADAGTPLRARADAARAALARLPQ